MEEENVGMSKAKNKVLSPGDQTYREEAGIPQTLYCTPAHVSKHFFIVTESAALSSRCQACCRWPTVPQGTQVQCQWC